MEFGQITAEALTAKKSPALSVTTHTTITEAAALLRQQNILSVPVYSEETNSYVAFFDVLDLLAHTALVHHHRKHFETLEDLDAAAFTRGIVSDILEEEHKRKIHVFGIDAKLINILKIMEGETYRVLVAQRVRQSTTSIWWFNTPSKREWTAFQYTMLSQTDIVNYLSSHGAAAKLFGNFTVADVPGVMSPQATLPNGSQAIDGFLMLIDNHLHAIAIVNSQGSITGVLSASDLRGISAEKFKRIVSPVEEFVKVMSGSPPKAPVICSPQEPLLTVINRIRAARVHQCWVVDANNRPIGCLTMSRIIKKARQVIMTANNLVSSQ